MAGNLTRAEAVERARLLSVERYAISLDLTRGPAEFGSVTVVDFACREPGATTFVELAGADVAEVVLNGRPLARTHHDAARGRITLPDLEASNRLRVVATAPYSRTGQGLHRFVDPVDAQPYLYTHFATADAQRVFACFDQPDLKAAFELTVLAPADWHVVSNAPASREAGDQPTEESLRRWHFPAGPRLSTYVTALAAGPYHRVGAQHVTRDGRTVELGVHCRRSLAGDLDATAVLAVTRAGLDYFEQAFAMPFPFEKYDQLFVPELNVGAMENAGCVTLKEEYVFRSRVTEAAYERRAETILHELSHMWFGDLVTMRWWDDLWLNESLATYLGLRCQADITRWDQAWTTFAIRWKSQAYEEDQLPSTHPVAADIPDVAAVEFNFDAITYLKGAAVLQQLVAYVGDEAFLDGLRRYLHRHAWGSTTLVDFLSALEEASERSLATWSAEWLGTAGVATLQASFDVDAQGRFTSFAVRQTPPSGHPVLRSQRVSVGLYARGADGITLRQRVAVELDGACTRVPGLVGSTHPGLVLLNDDDTAYAKARLDPRSFETVLAGIGAIRDPLAAAVCWTTAWDMTRDAELDAADFVRLVLDAIPSVTHPATAQTLLRQAAVATRRYADPGWRARGLEQIGTALHSLLLFSAAPGSDLQLVLAQAFVDVASSPAHLTVLRRLLDGSPAVDGLEVDADLRWSMLRRLVSRGAAGPTWVDEELERDRTAAGRRSAIACRAAVPTAAAKQAAWRQVIAGELSAADLRATLSGFADADQRDLLEPFGAAYFDHLGRVWAAWPSDLAAGFVRGAYPARGDWYDVARTDAYLRRDGVPPVLRRLLSECRDELARSLHAQNRSASAPAPSTRVYLDALSTSL